MITWRHVAVVAAVCGGAVSAGTGSAVQHDVTPAAVAAPQYGSVGPGTHGPATQVITLTNNARGRAGCEPLTVDPRLSAAAQKHSTDMAERGYFAHDNPDGESFADRETVEGYPRPGGENIAYGQESAGEVVEAWLASPAHRRNILNCAFTTIGIGYEPDGHYWTQDFGR